VKFPNGAAQALFDKRSAVDAAGIKFGGKPGGKVRR